MKTNNLDNPDIQRTLMSAKDLQSAGLEMEKSWSACDDGKDCEICMQNEKAGWIPLDQPFPSGHQIPLAHDECRCDLLTRMKPANNFQNEVPNKFTGQSAVKKRLPLILGILAFCCIATVIFGALLPETSGTSAPSATPAPSQTSSPPTLQPTQSSRCLPASSEQMEYIRAGIQGVQPSNDVLPGFAVRSNDYERVWFVAAEITGPGIEPKQAIGLWAINGELDEPGIILSVNGFALEFTEYPDGSTTDAQTSQFDDGAQEALACAANR